MLSKDHAASNKHDQHVTQAAAMDAAIAVAKAKQSPQV